MGVDRLREVPHLTCELKMDDDQVMEVGRLHTALGLTLARQGAVLILLDDVQGLPIGGLTC